MREGNEAFVFPLERKGSQVIVRADRRFYS